MVVESTKGPMMGPRSQRASPDGKVDQKTLRIQADLDSLLQGLQAAHQVAKKTGQDVFAGVPELGEQIGNLQRTHGVHAMHDVRILYDVLFEAGIPTAPLENFGRAVAQHGIPEEQKFNPAYIRKRFFGEGVVPGEGLLSQAEIQCTMGGDAWLQDFIKPRGGEKFSLESARRVQLAGRTAEARYGPGAAAVTRLMYMCSHQDHGKPSPTTFALSREQRLERLTMSDLHDVTDNPDSPKTFFEQMRHFLSVYADITSKVLANARTVDARKEIGDRASSFLVQFIQSEEFQAEKVPDPFVLFQQKLLSDASGKLQSPNPWVFVDTKETPFTVAKFGLMMTEDGARGLTADSVEFLNNYKGALIARKTRDVLEAVRKHQELSPKPLPAKLIERLDYMCEEVRTTGYNIDPKADSAQRIDALGDFVKGNIVFPKGTDEGMHPFTTLIRMIDPEKIVANPERQSEFVFLLREFENEIERVKEGKGNVEGRTRIIASSVKELLQSDDPFLDIPLSFQANQSIRMLITNGSNEWFDKDILAFGPYARSDKSSSRHLEPLIRPRDLSDKSPVEIMQLKKNFNTAKGVDMVSKRNWIQRTTDRWNDLKDVTDKDYSADKNYRMMLNFTHGVVDKFWGMQSKFAIAIYPSASAAMNGVFARLLPTPQEGDYLIVSKQEYDGMTDVFIDKNIKIVAIDCNQPADMIFADIQKEVKERGRPYYAALLSSKTRLGDSSGIGTGKDTPSIYALGALNQMLKKAYPTKLIAVDGCQSVGRNDRGENDINRLYCDVYISSGGKALGVRNVGVAALRKPQKGESEHWLSHLQDHPQVLKNPVRKLGIGKSTIDIGRAAGLGIALQQLDSNIDTWGLGHPGEKQPQQREVIAQRMQELTRHTITRANEYARNLLTDLYTDPAVKLRDPLSEELIRNPAVQKQFGCLIVHPAVRKDVDYNGILAIRFPSMGARVIEGPVQEGAVEGSAGERTYEGDDYILTELQKLGYSIEHCLGTFGIRISFHPLHTESDIDELFEDLRKIHVGYLKKIINEKALNTFAELQDTAPNVPDGIWEKKKQ